MKKVVLFFLAFIWQIPQNIVALFLMLIWRKCYYIRRFGVCRAYCVTKGFHSGISLGNFCFVGEWYDTLEHYFTEPYLMHELKGHSVQSLILGPLYLIVIGIPSLIYCKIAKNDRQYYNFYTERWANRIAKIRLNEYEFLEMIKD